MDRATALVQGRHECWNTNPAYAGTPQVGRETQVLKRNGLSKVGCLCCLHVVTSTSWNSTHVALGPGDTFCHGAVQLSHHGRTSECHRQTQWAHGRLGTQGLSYVQGLVVKLPSASSNFDSNFDSKDVFTAAYFSTLKTFEIFKLTSPSFKATFGVLEIRAALM